MKKIISALLLVSVLVALCACGGGNTEKEYKLGMGVAFGELKASEINATVAAVVLDKDGKIVSCRIDAIQNKFTVGEDAVSFTKLVTKMELGDDYGMKGNPYSSDNGGAEGCVTEWYEQAKAFESYVVGKTAAEVEAMATTTLDNGYVISADEALLNAGCTIQITDFKAAVVKACNDDQGVSFKTDKSFTLGVAANSEDDGSSVNDEGIATVKANSDIAAAVVVDGKIVATVNDAIQPQLKIEEGEVTSKSVGKGEGVLKTKRELKEDYGMKGNQWSSDNGGAEGCVTEWYEQSKAFSDYVTGKTGAEVEALATKTLESGYVISADDALLNAGCTIQITGIKAVVAESVANAR